MRSIPRLLLALLLCFSGAAVAVDEPAYRVLQSNDAFELRRYAPYVVAEIAVEGSFKGAGMKAFRPLARFIGGNNEGRQKIEMTAPVTQRRATPPRGQAIPMTAPVTQEPDGEGRHRVGFVMPEDMTLETTPVPKDPRITLREVPERLLAVARYSGTWSEKRYARQEAELLAALESAGLTPVSDPVWARYNGPMTPWFLRRNEIMVEVRR